MQQARIRSLNDHHIGHPSFSFDYTPSTFLRSWTFILLFFIFVFIFLSQLLPHCCSTQFTNSFLTTVSLNFCLSWVQWKMNGVESTIKNECQFTTKLISVFIYPQKENNPAKILFEFCVLESSYKTNVIKDYYCNFLHQIIFPSCLSIFYAWHILPLFSDVLYSNAYQLL